ncbi:phosphoserine transaminase [Jonesia quinghaiensis]|uniref:phosphoserine transaminase n=1 Tax=Jonesia quinghaiensis TaxID=262806 RepID=UPI0005666A60
MKIPASLLPRDGRFGSGPSKVRSEQVDALATSGRHILGTSHRQAPVKDLVGRIQQGLCDMFDAPAGYEVLLGNGGSTALWDALTFSIVRERAAHAAFGEFGNKFVASTSGAPFLKQSAVTQYSAGTAGLPAIHTDADIYAWPHNETSTGAMAPITRITDDALMIIDATSAAGGLPVDLNATDMYYFAPQKNFAADGGLWLSFASPAAIERIESIATTDRWIPEFLSLSTALTNSRARQTLNTPALATLIMLADQIEWFNRQGGLSWATQRTATSSSLLYTWAQNREFLTPFVADPAHRSQVVATLDLDDSIDAMAVSKVLRANGVVDIDPYRKLGRNQLRIAVFPAVDPADVESLTACIDFVVEAMS